MASAYIKDESGNGKLLTLLRRDQIYLAQYVPVLTLT